jgi:cold shock CspA family protein
MSGKNKTNGTIHIINSAAGYGRILLDDGRESTLLNFPPSFEEGDRVVAVFENNDPEKRLLNFHAPGEKWHFGVVVSIHEEKPFGTILSTYPKPQGVLHFYYNNLEGFNPDHLHTGLKVRFQIKKQANGRTQAVKISEVSKKNRYKCQSPVFARLQKKNLQARAGIISRIVRSVQPGNIVSGRVKYFNGSFGFITRDDGNRDVYFNGYLAESCRNLYGTMPRKGVQVFFRTRKSRQGTAVREFVSPVAEQPLSPEQQYGFISDSDTSTRQLRFRLNEFRRLHGREPESGDIVFFFPLSDSQASLATDENDRRNIYYLMRDGQHLTCPPSSFINFVAPEPNRLYFAYIAQKTVHEVYRFDSTQLAEAVICYKKSGIDPAFRLEAIETMLHRNFQDKKIRPANLRQQRLQLLDRLITQARGKGDYRTALTYENRYQALSYTPQRLASFDGLPAIIKLDLNYLPKPLSKLDRQEIWALTTTVPEKGKGFTPPTPPPYNLMLEKPSTPVAHTTDRQEKWRLFTDPPKPVRPLPDLEQRYILNLFPRQESNYE